MAEYRQVVSLKYNGKDSICKAILIFLKYFDISKRNSKLVLAYHVDSAIYRKSWAGYNAVLGEELAHLTIHRALLYYVNSPEDFIELQNDPGWHQFEQDARRFSLAIRMPSELVDRELSRIYARTIEEHGFLPAESIEAYIRNALAQRFRVSTDDARRRITNFPCDMGERLLNSIQAKSLSLLPPDWTVKGMPDRRQAPLFER